MARIRTVKPSFFLNEEIAALPMATRLLFIGLWTQADREGKLEDRPKRLKAEIFPYDSVDVDKTLSCLQSAGFIERYGGFIRVIPKDCLGIKRSFSIMDNDVREWIKIRHIIFKRDGKKCQYCGIENVKFHIDHIIPISNGGSDEFKNLTVSCSKCNIRKKNLPVQIFLNKYNLCPIKPRLV